MPFVDEVYTRPARCRRSRIVEARLQRRDRPVWCAVGPVPEDQLAAMLDNMRLFGMGYAGAGLKA